MDFSRVIKRICAIDEVSPTIISEMTGISKAVLSTYTLGQRVPSWKNIRRLAKVLKISAPQILGLERIEYAYKFRPQITLSQRSFKSRLKTYMKINNLNLNQLSIEFSCNDRASLDCYINKNSIPTWNILKKYLKNSKLTPAQALGIFKHREQEELQCKKPRGRPPKVTKLETRGRPRKPVIKKLGRPPKTANKKN